MLGALWWLRRRLTRGSRRQREAQPVTVVARQALGSKAQLVIVQTDDARYVLAVTERAVNVVDRLPVARAESFENVLASSAAAAPTDAFTSSPAAAPTDMRAGAAAVPTGVLAAAPTRRAREAGAPADQAVPTQRLRSRRRNDPLAGSILSPATWRQTADAFRRTP